MADGWFFEHQGQTEGPVSRSELWERAVRQQLLPRDPVWAEDEDRERAVEARIVVDFSSLPPAPAAVPDWLADVAQSELPVLRSAATPEWVDRLAEASEPTAGQVVLEAMPPFLPGSTGTCRVSIGCATSRGTVRERNEDHFLVQQFVWSEGEDIHEAALLAVADGMGGHKAGDRASALVIATLASVLSPVLVRLLSGTPREEGTPVLSRALCDALIECHRVITQAASQDEACRGMGSTAAVAVVWDGQVVIRHVGDCRVYHQRGDVLTQVTSDHTLVARMVERGQLTPEEAATHPARNEVTQALGKRAVEPSEQTLELQRDDWLLIACDGLTAHVEADTLRTTAQHAAPSAAFLAKRLVELANEGGGTDNCTVIAAHCY